ncbi:MAG TPA: dephospho-CoA kinase [Gemmatimonadaceae bacterium]
MLLVALTGNIASGKTEAARRLASLGATVIEADVLAREVVEAGQPAWSDIVARWGEGILDADRQIDRAALRRIVFTDPAARRALEEITHPRIEARRRALIDEARRRGDRIVVSDIPLLFETGMEGRFDRVILVDAPEAIRRERLVQRRGLSEADAQQMIAAQMPAALKRERADYVIENTGTLEELYARVDEVWAELQRQLNGNS